MPEGQVEEGAQALLRAHDSKRCAVGLRVELFKAVARVAAERDGLNIDASGSGDVRRRALILQAKSSHAN